MKKDRLIKLGILAAVTIVVSLLVCFVDKAPIGPKATVVGMSHINGFFRDIFKQDVDITVIHRVTDILALSCDIQSCLQYAFIIKIIRHL